MTEQEVIDQLTQYRKKQARIQVLSTYPVGAGITVSRLNEDDQLQDLHARLRGLPSYMYLSKHEQELEQAANAYLTRYPAGVKAQQRAIRQIRPVGEEDSQLITELYVKISKVVEARVGQREQSEIDMILDRMTELQDLQAEVNRVDTVLNALEQYKPDYAQLLRMIYVDGLEIEEIAYKMQLTERTIDRRRKKAESEYVSLAQ